MTEPPLEPEWTQRLVGEFAARHGILFSDDEPSLLIARLVAEGVRRGLETARPLTGTEVSSSVAASISAEWESALALAQTTQARIKELQQIVANWKLEEEKKEAAFQALLDRAEASQKRWDKAAEAMQVQSQERFSAASKLMRASIGAIQEENLVRKMAVIPWIAVGMMALLASAVIGYGIALLVRS
jgi:hypothetical protein